MSTPRFLVVPVALVLIFTDGAPCSAQSTKGLTEVILTTLLENAESGRWALGATPGNIFVDLNSFADNLDAVAESAEIFSLTQIGGRTFLPETRDRVVACLDGPRDCSVRANGLVMSLRSITVPEEGRVVAVARAETTQFRPSGRTGLAIAEWQFTLEWREGRWRMMEEKLVFIT